jgi:chromosome partitioning protein
MFKAFRAVAIIGQKGGTGKTTTAVELAVTAAIAGETVAVIDLDPQANAANWKDRRPADNPYADNPYVVATPPGRLKQTLDAARAAEADLAIIDTAGKAYDLAIAAARLADLVLIPCHGQIYDMETLPAVRDIVRAAGDPPAFVLYNGIHPRGKRIADELKALTKPHYGLEACPVHLTQRTAYGEAPAEGKAGQELDDTGKIAAEAQRLYVFICEQVNKFRSEHGNGEAAGRAEKRA